MVRHFFPQTGNRTIDANTNFPPQSISVGKIPDNWFDTAFKRRVPITIKTNQVPTAQSDFPFLFNSVLADLSFAKSNGDDIRFVLENKTVLDVEIQEIETGSGTSNFLIAWSKIPTIQDDLQFFMYYNNPAAPSLNTNEAVWSDYQNVLHMNQTPVVGPSILDSTVKGNNATPTLTGVTQANGKIGKALDFDGLTGFISGTFPINASFYISIWAKSNVTDWNEFGFVYSARGINGFIIHPVQNTKDVMYFIFNGTGTVFNVGTVTPIDITTFHKYGLSFNNSTNQVRIFLDGVETDNPMITIDRGSSNIPIRIGEDSAFGRFGDMVGDEAQIRSSFVSSDFVETEFNNQNAPDSFYTVGTVQTIP